MWWCIGGEKKKMNSRTSVLILYPICLDVFPLEMTADVLAADEIWNLCDLRFKFYSRWEAQEDGGTASILQPLDWEIFLSSSDTEQHQLSQYDSSEIRTLTSKCNRFIIYYLFINFLHQTIELLAVTSIGKYVPDVLAVDWLWGWRQLVVWNHSTVPLSGLHCAGRQASSLISSSRWTEEPTFWAELHLPLVWLTTSVNW